MTFTDQAARQVGSRRVFVIADPAMLANRGRAACCRRCVIPRWYAQCSEWDELN